MRAIIAVAVIVAFPASAQEPENIGDWTVYRETSLFDDSAIVTIWTESEEIYSPGPLRGGARLYIRCFEGDVYAGINFRGNYMIEQTIRTRVDDREPIDYDVLASVEMHDIGLEGDAAIGFVGDISGGDSLLMRAQSLERQFEIRFPIEGVGEAARSVWEACGR